MLNTLSPESCCELIAKELGVSKETVLAAYANSIDMLVGSQSDIPAKVFSITIGEGPLLYFAIVNALNGNGKEIWQGVNSKDFWRW